MSCMYINLVNRVFIGCRQLTKVVCPLQRLIKKRNPVVITITHVIEGKLLSSSIVACQLELLQGRRKDKRRQTVGKGKGFICQQPAKTFTFRIRHNRYDWIPKDCGYR